MNLLLGEWVGLNLTYFLSYFYVRYYDVAVPCQLLPPCHTTFTTHIRIEQKQNFSRIPSVNVVNYYYLLLYILLPQSQQQR